MNNSAEFKRKTTEKSSDTVENTVPLLCYAGSVFSESLLCYLKYLFVAHRGQEFVNASTLFQQLFYQLVSVSFIYVRNILVNILSLRDSLLYDIRNLVVVQRVEIFFGDSVAGYINVRLLRCLTSYESV